MSEKKSFDSLTPTEQSEMLRAARYDPFLKTMIDNGLSLTRENYIAQNDMKEPLDAEEESELPEPFRKR